MSTLQSENKRLKTHVFALWFLLLFFFGLFCYAAIKTPQIKEPSAACGAYTE